jgi:lantibiotic modifying enzyme
VAWRKTIEEGQQPETHRNGLPPDKLRATIQEAVDGLADPEMLNDHHLWFSEPIPSEPGAFTANLAKEVQPGFFNGIAGILYALSTVSQAGFDMAAVSDLQKYGLDYLECGDSKRRTAKDMSFASGEAGIITGLVQLELEKPGHCRKYLENRIKRLLSGPGEGIGLSEGIAGKGFALLSYVDQLRIVGLEDALKGIAETILTEQHSNGSWAFPNRSGNEANGLTLYDGTAGVVLYLLSMYGWGGDQALVPPIEKGLRFLQKHQKKMELRPYHECTEIFTTGTAGITLCFVEAYRYFGYTKFEEIFEGMVRYYPDQLHNVDLSLGNGLAGLGLVYLEAYRCTKKDKWRAKATDIAEWILHYSRKSANGSRYWLATNGNRPNASLFNGNAGIISFLSRVYMMEQKSFLPFIP